MHPDPRTFSFPSSGSSPLFTTTKSHQLIEVVRNTTTKYRRILIKTKVATVFLSRFSSKTRFKMTSRDPVLYQHFKGHIGTVLGMAYNPKDARLVTCSADKTVMVWQVSDFSNFLLKSPPDPLCPPFPEQGALPRHPVQQPREAGERRLLVPRWKAVCVFLR